VSDKLATVDVPCRKSRNRLSCVEVPQETVTILDIPKFPLNTLQDRSLGYSQCAEASSIRSLFLRNTSVYNADARSQHYTALCTGVAYASCGKKITSSRCRQRPSCGWQKLAALEIVSTTMRQKCTQLLQ